jgi:nitrogen fixation protein NifU and related proteins
MSDAIYQRELLRLAADATGAGHLENPDITVVHDNPLCGDRCTVDVRFSPEGRITELRHDVRACILVQASASILGDKAIGASPAELAKLESDVRAMLKNEAEAPPPPFSDYETFKPAAQYKNRHTCVLLPIEAVLKAFAELSSK